MGVKQCALLLLLCVGVHGVTQYSGVEVKVMVVHFLSKTFVAHAKRWEALTGGKVKFTLMAKHDDVLKEVPAEGESGVGHDAYIFTSTAMPELADKGYLADLTDLVDEDVQLDWTDIVPFIRRNNVGFNRRVYGLPFDGDALVLVYRDDLVAGPPKTLEELVDEAVRLNGKDLNNDGIPDSGWCECWAPSDDGTVYYVMGDMLMNAVTPYLQSKGSDQGAFFNPETLDALSYTSAWKKAFALLIRLYKEGSDPVRNRCDGRDKLNGYGAGVHKFLNGTCAFHSFWSGNAMVKAAKGTYGNYSRPYLKHSVFPGSTEVDVDGVLTECTKEICPHAKRRDAYGRLVNSAPFAAYGGFIAAIANHSKNVQAAYDFLSYCNRPENSAYDVVLDDGMDPWRTSQLLPQLWESKIPSYLVSSFLSTTREILNNENVVIDLRIPGAGSFIIEAGKVLDMAMRDQIPIEAAPQVLKDAWDAVIEKNGGRTRLLPLYRKSLNLPPLQTGGFLHIGSDFSLEGYQVALIVIGALLIVAVVAGAVWRARSSQRAYLRQFDNNVVAENCALAIAAMDFEKVRYLRDIEKPNGIQQAFIDIVSILRVYRPYLPAALFSDIKGSLSTLPVLVEVPGCESKTATIVFTDIVSSTYLWECSPHGMRSGLRVHNFLIREAIELFSGYEVKTIGDSFMVAFSTTREGVEFGLKVQESLNAAEWPELLLEEVPMCAPKGGIWGGVVVRIGVNSGPVVQEENTLTRRMDYFGHTVNVAARLEGQCKPGAVAMREELWKWCSTCEAVSSRPQLVELKGVTEGVQICHVWPTSLKQREQNPLRVENMNTAKQDGKSMSVASSLTSTLRNEVRSSVASFSRGLLHNTAAMRVDATISVFEVVLYDPDSSGSLMNVSQAFASIAVSLEQSGGGVVALVGSVVWAGWNLNRNLPSHPESAIQFVSKVSGTGVLKAVGMVSGVLHHGVVESRTQSFVTVVGTPLKRCYEVYATALASGELCLYEPAEGSSPSPNLQELLIKHTGGVYRLRVVGEGGCIY